MNENIIAPELATLRQILPSGALLDTGAPARAIVDRPLDEGSGGVPGDVLVGASGISTWGRIPMIGGLPAERRPAAPGGTGIGRRVNLIFPPWEVTADPNASESDPPGVLLPGFTSPTAEALANGAFFRTGLLTGAGLYWRVAAFALSGHAVIARDGGNSAEGELFLRLPALDYGGFGTFDPPSPLTSEEDICRHGGWAASAEQAPWTLHGMDGDETIDIGTASLSFGHKLAVDDPVRPSVLFFQPAFSMSVNVGGGPISISAGKGSGDDLCRVKTTLPFTSGASFDGYDEGVAFEWQLGSEPGYSITGSLTMQPTEWWFYRDASLGNLYAPETGAHHRPWPGL